MGSFEHVVQNGELAPDFTLPGVVDNHRRKEFNLRESVGDGNAVLLLFYPFDFSPVCTTELCAIRDANWFDLTPGLDVWAISGDSVYAHEAFADEYDLQFPLLSDSVGRVADAYGVQYDEWDGHECVPKRSVVLIDGNQRVRYNWHTDDAFEKPDFFPVKAALDEIVDEKDRLDPVDVEMDVEYDEDSLLS